MHSIPKPKLVAGWQVAGNALTTTAGPGPVLCLIWHFSAATAS